MDDETAVGAAPAGWPIEAWACLVPVIMVVPVVLTSGWLDGVALVAFYTSCAVTVVVTQYGREEVCGAFSRRATGLAAPALAGVAGFFLSAGLLLAASSSVVALDRHAGTA